MLKTRIRMISPAMLSGLAVCVLLTSCAGTASVPTATESAPVGSASSSPGVGALMPPVEDDRQAPEAAVLTSDDRAAAVELATAVMAAFSRTDVDAQAWINGLYPLLTAKAASRAEGTNPALVPVHTITGPAVLNDRPTRIGAVAMVPTDAGIYTLLLVWDERAGVWLCDRIGAPRDER
ncbi:hypothetical protein [Plantibacter sp. CFBP 13570]|uniref:hypothetical protein n=1 Tax=Plantibacter sp. CFBP 13570 TaxID=2775272 RepID=UPI0019308D83|nr:hypothetical protein [Plantibacter sp. CFBP 13570]MBD8535652.1 hypothetical protein [Plantibacter sp. CFBP 13570]